MTVDQMLAIPVVYDRADALTNAAALRRMSEGIHYDDTPGELAEEFAFLFGRSRADAPRAIYRWQRSLPGVRVLPNQPPRPRPRRVEAGQLVGV